MVFKGSLWRFLANKQKSSLRSVSLHSAKTHYMYSKCIECISLLVKHLHSWLLKVSHYAHFQRQTLILGLHEKMFTSLSVHTFHCCSTSIRRPVRMLFCCLSLYGPSCKKPSLPRLPSQGLWMDYPAPPTWLLWANPADLPSTTSAGSGLSSQRMQCNSWSKRWSSQVWTTATPAWLDYWPLQLNCCSVSRALQHASFSIYQILPCEPPPPWPPLASCCGTHLIQDDGAGDGNNGTAPIYLQTLVRPHTPAQALCSTTSAGRLVPPSLRANKAIQRSRDLSGGTNSNVRTADSLAIFRKRLKTHLFRLHLNPA